MTRIHDLLVRHGFEGSYDGPTRFAHLHPDETIYTFWKYLRRAFERDAGLRINHHPLNPVAAARLVAPDVDRDPRSWEKTSDHSSVWIELSDRPKREQ